MIHNKGYYEHKAAKYKSRLISDYRGGLDVALLANKYNYNRKTVFKLFRRWGVQIRPVGSNLLKYVKRFKVDESAFSRITSESAYWVGFLMADGCIITANKTPQIQLGLSRKDANHLWKFRKFLKTKAKVGKCGNPNAVQIRVSSRKLVESLRRFGVVPRKSFTAKVKGLENNRHFWRGVIDGDGHITRSNDKYKYALIHLCGSKFLVSQFRDFVKSISSTKAEVHSVGSIFRINIRGSSAVSIIRKLYEKCSTSLDRKRAIADEVLYVSD